jgi:hypothetical protein
MADAVLRGLAFWCCVCGMGWLALTMKPHWAQVRGGEPLARETVLTLRGIGTVALLGALVLCSLADHASIAALVWVMALSAATFLVAATLTWRPSWLAPLVVWVSRAPSSH